MKKVLFLFFVIGLTTYAPAVQAKLPVAMLSPVDEEMSEDFFEDDLDNLIDDAVQVGAVKKNIKLKEFSPTQKFFIKLAMPLVRLYSFTVLHYRGCKEWFAKLWVSLVGA